MDVAGDPLFEHLTPLDLVDIIVLEGKGKSRATGVFSRQLRYPLRLIH